MSDMEKSDGNLSEFVTVSVDDQLFGFPVLDVEDVLSPHSIVRIPLAPGAVAGSLNLRGRIVTAIDLRVCLGMSPCEDPSSAMGVVVEYEKDLFSLLVDSVGEVMSLSSAEFEKAPMTLDPSWRDLCAGVFRLDDRLLLQLDAAKVLAGLRMQEAA